MIRILITGDYDPFYNRTRILLNGLKKNQEVKISEFPIKSLKNFDSEYFKKLAGESDFIYLPPFTHKSVSFIKKVAPGNTLVFDPLISRYLTKVYDYKQIIPFSPRALQIFFNEKLSLKRSDIILADTNEHKKYYARKFKISPERIFVLPVGVDTTEFIYREKQAGKYFEVGFYGGFIPLHGVKTIIEAARLLKQTDKIRIRLIGTGFEYHMIQKLVKKYRLVNVDFEGWIKYQELSEKISSFDVCLGIFGKTPKTNLVIPNKIFHYAAQKKCIITKDTPAIREIFTDKENILLSSGDPHDLSQKIMDMRDDPALVGKISESAYELVSSRYNENRIADSFIRILKGVKPGF